MRKRILQVALVVTLAVTLAAGFVSTALAASWSDLPDTLLAPYGITNDQVAQISVGFDNGLWRPWQKITRAQFIKMADAALGISPAHPGVPTFSDVQPTNLFYPYVEGAAAAGIVNGVSAGHFGPDAYITREQGIAIIARAVALATGQDLANTYTPSQITSWLATFGDGSSVSTTLRSAVAFAINLGIVSGDSGSTLAPRSWLTRVQAATLLIRGGAPTVESIKPGKGGAAGGNTVTVAGTGFIGATAVKFGSTDAQSFTVVSDTQIRAVVPVGTAGTSVDVLVVNPVGTSAAWEVTYTYTYDIPTVSSVNPNSGSASGGNTAIIIGTGFTGTTAVQFGSTDAQSFTVVSDTQIKAVVPVGAAGTTVGVTVVNTEGTSGAGAATCLYTYDYPAVTSVSPNDGSATGGNTVTVTGTGFANLTGSDGVRFGSTDATSYTVLSDIKITAVVPPGAAGETVSVTVAGQQADWSVEYTYDYPTVTSVTPGSGPAAGGNTVNITGSGFLDAIGVRFGSTDAMSYNVVSDTRIRAVAPAWTGDDTVEVTVITFDGTTASWADGYTYTWETPTVTSVSPNNGPAAGGGDPVTIVGTGFVGATEVWFGSAEATSFTVVSDTRITAVVPPGTAGTVYVKVSNPAGRSKASATYLYK